MMIDLQEPNLMVVSGKKSVDRVQAAMEASAKCPAGRITGPNQEQSLSYGFSISEAINAH
jgi:hypothetical protein